MHYKVTLCRDTWEYAEVLVEVPDGTPNDDIEAAGLARAGLARWELSPGWDDYGNLRVINVEDAPLRRPAEWPKVSPV